nr:hypothetical protein F0321_04150 [Enterobacter asburiae]KAA0533199.1 hypothetical protein F0320_09255 [Enterobacter dykesii]
MNVNLYHLIIDFQSHVEDALKLMYRSGIQMPSSCNEWIDYDIPFSGELTDGVKYFKHGAGCRVDLNSGTVDFDFGEHGEIGGFNSWWLTAFAGSRLPIYGFSNYNDVDDHLKQELEKGHLSPLNQGLYYIANAPLKYALDIDARAPEDKLPSRNQDHVLTLQIHYFETAELMLRNYNKLKQKMKKNGSLIHRDEFDMRVYLFTWLGFLGVVCEGFRNLNMRILLAKERPNEFKELISISDKIGKLMKENSNSLRIFRNNVFHLRENTESVRQFFDAEVNRIQWAKDLQAALSDFFSNYRVFCEVHYLVNGRNGESDFIREKLKRQKKSNLKLR